MSIGEIYKQSQGLEEPKELKLQAQKPKTKRRRRPTAPSFQTAQEWSDFLLRGMNPEQQEVITHKEGPLLAAAVAGAGKTAALVRRIGYLVKFHGVNPNRILAVTFSKKGGDEMSERLDGLIGKTGASVGTFHSLALRIVKAEVAAYAEDWEIDSKGRFRYCVKDAVGYTPKDAEIRRMDWKEADPTLLVDYISYCKAHMARPDSEAAMTIAEERYYRKNPGLSTNPTKMVRAYHIAEELRIDRQLLTFDDMMMEAVELMRDDEGIRCRWASQFDYVLQDEAQDQNLCQLLLGELFSRDHRNYMLVGDPAQTIYTWRGAQPDKLLGFEQTWGAKVVQMNRNYRCGQSIIDTANRALRSMDPSTRLDMEMVCERGTEGNVSCKLYEDLDVEGEDIANSIAQMREDGVSLRNIVILYRTNAQSRAPEEALISSRIPYRIIGGTNFYERREIKALLAYLRTAYKPSPSSITACINTPFRYLGKVFVTQFQKSAARVHQDARARTGERASWGEVIDDVADELPRFNQNQQRNAYAWASLIDRLTDTLHAASGPHASEVEKSAAKPARLLEDILLDTGYIDFLRKDEGEESPENSRVSNVRELIRAAERFTTVSELLDYIDDTIARSKAEAKERHPDKVTLTTLHRSKGLEWPTVFMIGVSDRILPHGRCEDIEEERRLFYVGVTRARDNLVVSAVNTACFGDKVVYLGPSPFIGDVELEFELDNGPVLR